jgi:hypothetical protein
LAGGGVGNTHICRGAGAALGRAGGLFQWWWTQPVGVLASVNSWDSGGVGHVVLARSSCPVWIIVDHHWKEASECVLVCTMSSPEPWGADGISCLSDSFVLHLFTHSFMVGSQPLLVAGDTLGRIHGHIEGHERTADGVQVPDHRLDSEPGLETVGPEGSQRKMGIMAEP